MRDLDRQMDDLRAQQASAWVSELATQGVKRHNAFAAWLKESPANVREFMLAYSIEQSLEQLDTERRVDVQSLLAQVNARVTQLPTARNTPNKPASLWSRIELRSLYKVAAGIAAVSLLGAWAILQRSGWQEYGTGTGEQRALQLEDGSIVHLNAHSRIALRFSATARDIKLLEGGALFEVHHDEQRPFQVFTRDAIIRDIGTRFDVHSRSDGVKIAVIEGSVEVTTLPEIREHQSTPTSKSPNSAGGNRPEKHIVKATQEAQVDREGVVTVESIADIADATAWWQRRLIYRKETLNHIVEDFNRYNRKQIRLEGEAVQSRTYTGVFDADDPESLALVLASDPVLLVERPADDKITIRPR